MILEMSTPEQRAKRAAYMRAYLDEHPEQRAKTVEQSRRWREANRERHRAYQREYTAKNGQSPYNPTSFRRHRLKKKGLTEAQYAMLLEQQGGGCYFCGRANQPRRSSSEIGYLCVDHDHATGRVRGLLCVGCNISLGCYERGQKSRLDKQAVAAYMETTKWL